jgi:hypothetical protein
MRRTSWLRAELLAAQEGLFREAKGWLAVKNLERITQTQTPQYSWSPNQGEITLCRPQKQQTKTKLL